MDLRLGAHKNASNNIPVPMEHPGDNQIYDSYTTKTVGTNRREMVFVNPQSAISQTLLSSNNVVDYRWENNIDLIKTAYLRIKYNNSSGSNCVHATPAAFLSNIELYSDNGSTLLFNSTNSVENWLVNNLLLSRNEHELTASQRGTDATYTSPEITVANGASGYYYVWLLPLIYSALKIRPYSVEGNFLLRVRFASNNISSGTMTTEECVLVVSGIREDEITRKYVLANSDIPKRLSYYGIQRHVDQRTLAASSKYQIKLTGITGLVNSLFFILREAAYITDTSDQFTFTRVDQFDILDSSNRSLTGYKIQQIDDMILEYSHQVNNLFINNSNIHFWSFSEMPISDYITGSSNGCVPFNSQNILEIYTPAALTPGDYQIIVVCLTNELMTIDDGYVKTTRN